MTQRQPLVTVAMPIYNGAATLERALGLIRSQTYRDLDIILCDDASTDATPDICAAAAREDDRIRFIRHPRNLGMTGNFNYALPLKRGELFMWAGQDDEKLPGYVASAVAPMVANPRIALACTWTVLVTPEGERVHRPYSPAIASEDLAERLQAFVSDTQCVAIYGLFRSSVLDAIGPMPPWLDTDRHYLFMTAIRGPFAVVPEPLFRYTLIHGAEDYVRMGLFLRPGAADFDLDLYRYLPRLVREAGVDHDTAARVREVLETTLTPYLDRRAAFLIGSVVHEKAAALKKVRRLFAYARQYPPMAKTRMFWGAMRRALTPRL